MARPKIICLTPVRNESWVLERFLKAASLWADYIIVADQQSTDGSREIAQSFSKVRLIENNSVTFNEVDRQKMLIRAAREIEGPRLLITLDADELFSPELFTTNTWNQVLNSEPGTIFKFQWASFLPGHKRFWLGYHFPWGYMDDGAAHSDSRYMHSSRIPLPEGHPTVEINDIKVIHYQYSDPDRNRSKQRWYQCLELENPTLANNAIGLYRKYHQSEQLSEDRIFDIPDFWIDYYQNKGIDILQVQKDEHYWYDEEVVKLFEKHGVKHYRKLDIWTDVMKDKDPRGLIDKMIHCWLERSQPHYFTKARKIDGLIQKLTNY